MKQKIIIFLVGLLLGAIISTSSIYIYTLATSNSNGNTPNNMEMQGNMNGGNGNMQEPPSGNVPNTNNG